MKIKSIQKTDKYAEVPFSDLKEDWENNPNGKHEVYTPNGWTEIRNFSYIKTGPSKVITHGDYELVCDPGHVLQIYRDGVPTAARADQLDQDIDWLCSYDCLTSFSVQDGLIEDFYDITIDDPHWWYTSGLVSHNSIVLCNNAITSWQGPGPGGRIGQDVLLVTFELDYIKTGMRCLGVINENIPLDKLVSSKDLIHSRISSMKTTYDGRIFIAELPPEECSVDHLYHLLDNMRRQHGWHPDVVILDYLDLMMSRQKSYNDSDYTRQKHVANEVRGFAKNENVLVFTATQTNRGSGQNGQDVGLKDAAESYAKQFSMDYIVAIAQNPEEREASPSRFRFQIAKNRNGPKQKTITCEVNYNTMKVKEVNS